MNENCSTEKSPWEANSSSDYQENPSILWNPKVLCSPELTTCPCSEPEESSTCLPILFLNINFNTILAFNPMYCWLPSSCYVPTKNPLRTHPPDVPHALPTSGSYLKLYVATSCCLQSHKSRATVIVLLLHCFYTTASTISESFIKSWNELSLFPVGIRQSLCYRPSLSNCIHFANIFKPAVAKILFPLWMRR